jgi:hypothetical protein
MTDNPTARPARPHAPSATDLDTDTLRELTATPPYPEQDGAFDTSEVELRPETVTDGQLYEGDSGLIGEDGPIGDAERLELLEDAELRSDETSDPLLASEEGLAYVPPVDPPVIPSDNPEGAEIAAGFASSRTDESFDSDHLTEVLPAEDEMTARVRDALRSDATTAAFADSLDIESDGGLVILRGVVEDLEDDDNAVAVAAEVPGVEEVVDALEVPGI